MDRARFRRAADNPLTVIDANTHTMTYVFDPVNRQTAITDGNNHTTTFQYDNNDNVTLVIDANTNRTTYSYGQPADADAEPAGQFDHLCL